MRILLLLFLLPLAFAAGVLIQNRDLNVSGGNIYVDGSRVLTVTDTFSNTSTSDVNVTGTYNSLDLQIKAAAIGPNEINSLENYTVSGLTLTNFLLLSFLSGPCNLEINSDGYVVCGSSSLDCTLCSSYFVDVNGDTMNGPLEFNLPSSDDTATEFNETTDFLVVRPSGDHAGIWMDTNDLVVWSGQRNDYGDIHVKNVYVEKLYDPSDKPRIEFDTTNGNVIIYVG